MKSSIVNLRLVVVCGLAVIGSGLAFAQTSTVTTVTSTGTVSEFNPNMISVREDSSPTPVRYTFSRTTTYVDENGNPVSVETVKAGAPVVIYYEKNGDTFVADKVVVKKSVTTVSEPPTTGTTTVVQQQQQVAPPQTTTTTTTTPPTQPTDTSTPPSVTGIVSEADSDDISIHTSTSADRVHYKAHDYTTYVDESGAPISRHALKEGTPVTVYFEREGDNLTATRVIVKSSATISQ